MEDLMHSETAKVTSMAMRQRPGLGRRSGLSETDAIFTPSLRRREATRE